MPISPRALDTLQRAVDEVGHTIIVTCAEGCKHYLYPRPTVPSDMPDRRIRNADIAEGFAEPYRPRGPADLDGDEFPGYSPFGG